MAMDLVSGAGQRVRDALRLLVSMMWRQPLMCTGWLLTLLASTAATLALPLALRYLIDHDLAKPAEIHGAFLPLILAGLLLAVTTSCRMYFVSEMGDRVVATLRKELFVQILDKPMEFHHKTSSAELLSRLTTDAEHFRVMLSAAVSIALRAIITTMGAVAMLFATSPKLALWAIVAIALGVGPIVLRSRRLRAMGQLSQDLIARSTAIAAEAIAAVRTVKEFAREEHEEVRYSRAIEDTARSGRRRVIAQSVLSGGAISMVFGAIILVLWIGAGEVVAGKLTSGQFAQFMFYAVIGGSGMTELLEIWGSLQRSSGGVAKIAELYEPGRERPMPGMANMPPTANRIRFERVRFSYPSMPNKPVLESFSMVVEPGQRVALVGPSGAGKSTLFSLLLRLYDPAEGRILVCGIDIRNCEPRAVRKMVAIVPQAPTIFAVSARENIRYGRLEATDEEVEAAAIAAEADEFIRELPRGYDEPLGERGVVLSGGQQQRIAIARAMLKNAPILLLDEATSALDAQSEHAVHTALNRLMAGRTTLIIAHRLSTIKDADHIVVLNSGSVVETGSHHDLLMRGGLYANLAKLQFIAA